MSRKSNTSQLFSAMLLALGCAAYSLPWLTNPGNGLSFAAYDLAEWTSLHPAVRNGNPAMVTALLLRLPLACLGLIISIGFLREKLVYAIAAIVLTGIALLPPLEFFTQYRDDPNYQQQFFLAAITWATGVVGIAIRQEHFTKLVVVLVIVAGAGSSLAGLLHGYVLLEQFKLSTQFGLGGFSMVAIYATAALYFFRTNKELIEQTR